MKQINSKRVYDAIYKALEECDYSKKYEIENGYKLYMYDSENEHEPWFEMAVTVETPKGEVETFTIAFDGKTQKYRIPTFAQLFAGEVDLISECAEEIVDWIKNEAA